MSEACEKSGKLVCHEVTSNIAIDSLPTLQMSLGIVALFEMIYDGEPILTVFSNIWDAVSVQYRCFNEGYDGKVCRRSQTDTMPILGNNFCLQMIETGFAEQF